MRDEHGSSTRADQGRLGVRKCIGPLFIYAMPYLKNSFYKTFD